MVGTAHKYVISWLVRLIKTRDLMVKTPHKVTCKMRCSNVYFKSSAYTCINILHQLVGRNGYYFIATDIVPYVKAVREII